MGFPIAPRPIKASFVKIDFRQNENKSNKYNKDLETINIKN